MNVTGDSIYRIPGMIKNFKKSFTKEIKEAIMAKQSKKEER